MNNYPQDWPRPIQHWTTVSVRLNELKSGPWLPPQPKDSGPNGALALLCMIAAAWYGAMYFFAPDAPISGWWLFNDILRVLIALGFVALGFYMRHRLRLEELYHLGQLPWQLEETHNHRRSLADLLGRLVDITNAQPFPIKGVPDANSYICEYAQSPKARPDHQDIATAEDLVGFFQSQIDAALKRPYQFQAALPLGKTPNLQASEPYGSRPLVFPLTLRYKDRPKGVHVLGVPGVGKSKLIKNMILHDVLRGHGVTVLTPDKAFLERELLRCLPHDTDVIFFDPRDSDRPITFNPLELQPGEDIDLKADELFSILRQAIGDTSPRMVNILRESIYALLERKNSTLLDFFELLPPYKTDLRQAVMSTTKLSHVREFFQYEYPTYPKDAARPILNRLSFANISYMQNAFCQPKSTLNFQRVMDGQKVLLCNISDSSVGPDNVKLMGQVIISAMQIALFRRDAQAEEERVPHLLFIDEFQVFTGHSSEALGQLFARARKYKLGLTVAHQHLGQLPIDIRKDAIGLPHTKICFKPSPDDLPTLEKHYRVEQEHFYDLANRQCYVVIGSTPYLIETEADRWPNDPERQDHFIEYSRKTYGQDPVKATPKAPQRTPDTRSTQDLPQTQEVQYNDDRAPKAEPRKPQAEFDPYKLE